MTGHNVLVVEDDPDLRELMAEDFKLRGWDVDQAENGCSAALMIVKKQYSCVFSDLKMPKSGGRFLAKKILEINGARPLLFIYSGYNDMGEQEAKSLGVSEVFAKPMPFSQIIIAIQGHLNKAPLDEFQMLNSKNQFLSQKSDRISEIKT